MRLMLSTVRYTQLCALWVYQLGISAAEVSSPKYQARMYHQAMVLGDYFYIEGGRISNYVNGENQAKGKDDEKFTPLKSTLSIPLHSSWDNSTVTIKTIDKPNDIPPPIIRSTLWSNDANDKMYRWGGERPGGFANDNYKLLYEFQSDRNGGGVWVASSPSNPETFEYFKHGVEGAGASCDNMGYYVGGWAERASDPSVSSSSRIGGLYTYNMNTREWNNISSSGVSSSGYIERATSVCVKGFGDNSLLMFFGGDVASITGGTSEGIKFGEIAFWDTATHTWYKQATTPTNEDGLPQARSGSCTVGVQGPNGTYEIYMYGGWDKFNKRTLDDVWVLTLPGFHWIKLDAPGATRREEHTCNLVGKRQMLVMGGIDDHQRGLEHDDPWPRGLGIFDLTKAEWSDKYDAGADDYQQPEVVRKWYDDGGLAKVKWDADNEKIFVTESTNSNITSTGNTAAKKSAKVSVGAVAGGVIGGVGGLALIGAALFLYRRRVHQHQQAPDKRYESPPEYKPLEATELDPHVVLRQPAWELDSRHSPVELNGVPEIRG